MARVRGCGGADAGAYAVYAGGDGPDEPGAAADCRGHGGRGGRGGSGGIVVEVEGAELDEECVALGWGGGGLLGAGGLKGSLYSNNGACVKIGQQCPWHCRTL